MTSVKKWLFGLVLCGAGLGSSTYLAMRLQRWDPHGFGLRPNQLIYLPSASQARLFSLGFSQVMADYYWVKGLQYFTEPVFAAVQYKNLGDFLEVVIGLDPDFEYAYKFAGIATPYDMGRNRIANAERSTSFLERGVSRFPQNWQLRFFLGYNYLNFHGQPQKAAEQFAEAAKIPGAPTYLKAFAARVYSVGGDVERALDFAQTMLNSTDDEDVRAMMKKRVEDLLAEKEIRRIEEGAKQFRDQMGRFPLDLGELVRNGFREPSESGYRLEPDGKAHPPDKYERMIIYVPHSEKEMGATTP